MNNLVTLPVLAGIGDIIGPWQWAAIAALIVLIIVFVKIRNKQS